MVDGPLKWPGGKTYLAKRIVELLPPHVHYVEPFFGGGAVLFAKPFDGVSEVVNDINGALTNFWRVLQCDDAFGRFRRIIEATPFSEREFWEAEGETVPRSGTPDHEAAAAFFVRCRQSRSGQMASFAPLSRNRTRRGFNEQSSAWLTAIEGLPAVHSRLKRVVILNSPADFVIRQQDGPNTAFFLDPPYVHTTRESKSLYEHEMSEADHVELLKLLVTLQGKVLLSGYQSQLYDDWLLPRGWNRLEFEMPNHMGSGKTKRLVKECLWRNHK